MNDPNRIIVIFGCGGHSRSVVDVLLSTNPMAIPVFVDENAREGEKIFGFDVFREYLIKNEQVFLAIGDNEARKRKFEEIGEKNLITIISGTSYQGYKSTIGAGCFVGNFSHTGTEAVIGMNSIVNTASIVEHEVTVGAHSHIGPNATISGRCTIGDLVFVGVGATVKDKVSVCSNVIIGAGATVVEDIVDPGTYKGTPAQRIE
ncbi:acetyltransferase [Thermodesulfobacteriota bacterium]